MGQAQCLSAGDIAIVRNENNLAERRRRERYGRRAEFLTANYLRLKGYYILETRFKTKSGEIDIIACKKDILVMVEVKARKDLQTAREAIGYKSQERIRRAAHIFIGRKKAYQKMGLRFDAVFLIGNWRLVHEPDFFR